MTASPLPPPLLCVGSVPQFPCTDAAHHLVPYTFFLPLACASPSLSYLCPSSLTVWPPLTMHVRAPVCILLRGHPGHRGVCHRHLPRPHPGDRPPRPGNRPCVLRLTPTPRAPSVSHTSKPACTPDANSVSPSPSWIQLPLPDGPHSDPKPSATHELNIHSHPAWHFYAAPRWS